MSDVIEDIDVALPLHDSRKVLDGCRCDASVGYVCEMCFTHATLCAARREIVQLRKANDDLAAALNGKVDRIIRDGNCLRLMEPGRVIAVDCLEEPGEES